MGVKKDELAALKDAAVVAGEGEDGEDVVEGEDEMAEDEALLDDASPAARVLPEDDDTFVSNEDEQSDGARRASAVQNKAERNGLRFWRNESFARVYDVAEGYV